MTDKPPVAPLRETAADIVNALDKRFTFIRGVPNFGDFGEAVTIAESALRAAGVAAVSPSEPGKRLGDMTAVELNQHFKCDRCGQVNASFGHVCAPAIPTPRADSTSITFGATDHCRVCGTHLKADGSEDIRGLCDKCAAPAVPPEPTPVGARDGWIPVETRLPEHGERVWVWNKAFGDGEPAQFTDGAFIDESGVDEDLTAVVTHWRPLPAPPNAADSRAPAEVLEALKRDVLAEVTTYGLRAGTNIATSLKSVRRRIEKLFDAAAKEPTK